MIFVVVRKKGEISYGTIEVLAPDKQSLGLFFTHARHYLSYAERPPFYEWRGNMPSFVCEKMIWQPELKLGIMFLELLKNLEPYWTVFEVIYGSHILVRGDYMKTEDSLGMITAGVIRDFLDLLDSDRNEID